MYEHYCHFKQEVVHDKERWGGVGPDSICLGAVMLRLQCWRVAARVFFCKHSPCLCFLQVMQGKIQVRARSQFQAALSTDPPSSSSKAEAGGSSAAAADSSSPAGASEADLKALFDSIDVDGSGGCC